MSRLAAPILLLSLLVPAAALAGDGVDHHAVMQGWWFFEQEPQDRREYNKSQQQLAADPSDEDARWTVQHFEEEGTTRLRVDERSAAAVGPDGDEELITYSIVSQDADGLTLSGREDKDDDPEVFRVTFGPAGRMTWTHAERDDALHFRRHVEAAALHGGWGIVLGEQELAELEEARRELENNPDDEMTRMMVEMMEEMLNSAVLTVTETHMALNLGGDAESVSYTARQRGGRLEVTTTEDDGTSETMFVVFEHDGSMVWTKEGEGDLLRFAPKAAAKK